MGIRIHTCNIPPLCGFAVGAALMLLVGGIAWWHLAKQGQQQWEGVYGNSLAVLTAKSAIDATLNHDLVSLQVVLQDVAQSEYVSLATIHDVENNLLVQAGDVNAQHLLKFQPVFSAPISFQQNIAGYVTVHLVHPKHSQTLPWVVLGGAFLLLLVAVLAFADHFNQVVEFFPRQGKSKKIRLETDEDNDDLVDAKDTVDDVELDADTFVAVATAEIILQIPNFEKLKQSLSAELTEQITQDLWGVTEQAIDIYGGQWSKSPQVTLDQGALCVLLPSALSDIDALRSALFLAHVIKSSFKPHKIKTQLDVVVAMQNDLEVLTRRPVASFAVHLSTAAIKESLEERIQFSSLDDDWYELVNFDLAYQKILCAQVEKIIL